MLEKMGVNSPPVSRLAYMLKQKGLYQGEFPVNVEEAYLVVKEVLRSSRDYKPGIKGV